MPPKPAASRDDAAPSSGLTSPAIIVTSIDVNHYTQLARENEPQGASASDAAAAAGSVSEGGPPPPHAGPHQRKGGQTANAARRLPPSPTSHTPSSTALVTVPAASSSAATSPARLAAAAAADPPLESVSKRALKEAAGGLGASIFSACCVYPIDLVKTRMQLPHSPIKSLFGGMAQIAREEGVLTLYTGLGSELVKAALQNFSYFYWYSMFKEIAVQRAMDQQAKTDTTATGGIHARGTSTSGFLREGGAAAAAAVGDASAELRAHQLACVDPACFCRSEAHLHAHNEAHKRNQIDIWREKAMALRLHKQRLLRRARKLQQEQQQLHPQLQQSPTSLSNLGYPAMTLARPPCLPRMLPSVSEPSLSGLSQHDLDDSPYVDVRSVDNSALITNTATVLPAPADVAIAAVTAAAAATTAPISPVAAQTPQHSLTPPLLPVALQLLLGTLAGCLTQVLVNPVSVIQTRMMTQKKQSAGGAAPLGFFALAQHILQAEGPSAFFAGILPAFILSSNPSIQFLVFDRLKSLVLRVLRQSGQAERSLSVFESFVIGAISKIVATLVTYPYIQAKVRLQYKGDGSGAAPALVYKGTIDVILRTLKYEGIRGLFAGLQAQLLKSVLGAALMFMAKEKLADAAKWVQRKMEGQHTKEQPTLPAPPQQQQQKGEDTHTAGGSFTT